MQRTGQSRGSVSEWKFLDGRVFKDIARRREKIRHLTRPWRAMRDTDGHDTYSIALYIPPK